MADNPLDPLETLKDRLAATAAPLGLQLHQFVVIVGGKEDEPSVVQAVFSINAEDVGRDAEQAEFDQEFDKLARSIQHDKQKDRESEAMTNLEEMRRRLEGGDGLLGAGA
jgi:hypothetical protein